MKDDTVDDDGDGDVGRDRSSKWSESLISRFILSPDMLLLIDDSPILCDALKTMLFNNGFLSWIFNNFLSLKLVAVAVVVSGDDGNASVDVAIAALALDKPAQVLQWWLHTISLGGGVNDFGFSLFESHLNALRI